MKNTKSISNRISLFFFGTLIFLAVFFVCFFLPGTALAAQSGYVDASDLNVRTGPGTRYDAVGTISYQSVTILGEEYDGDGDLWYRINYNGGEYYVYGAYVTVQGEQSSEGTTTAYGTFEEQLSRFPVTYRSLIEEIHRVYPNYIFEANYVSMSYDEAVYQETLDHRKLVSMDNDGTSWRSLSPNCYNRSTGTWSTFSGNWTDASVDVIEYYMDPRNFLTTRNMYIFAKQTYTGTESRSGVESIVAGSFLAGNYTDKTGTHSYIDIIMQVAAESHVSPYVIAATLRIEQPTGGDSPLIDGSYGYYNFFNFAASGDDVVGNGIRYAQRQGWDTVYKSILGGAQSYYNGYLQSGQDTYFYKDYNVINGNFDHQYAQGAYDQIGSGSFLRNAIGGDTSATMVLRIPVYTSMPGTPQGYPPETSSLSARYDSNGNIIPRQEEVIDTPEPPSPVTPVEPPSPETPSEPSEPSDPSEPKYKRGDANGDGLIDALDYVVVKNHIMGRKQITDPNKLLSADANGDGLIDALDYVRIKNVIRGRVVN